MNSYKEIIQGLETVLTHFYPNEANEPQRTVLLNAVQHFESLAQRDEKDASLQAIGESAARCLHDMVAALKVDYDRLEELKEERDNYVSDAGDQGVYNEIKAKALWVENNPNDAEELAQLEEAAGDCKDREEAEERIREDVLSVQMRGDWVGYGTEPIDAAKPVEFELLLSTGGPATRIIGELDEHGEVSSARLQAQDWFTVWTDYRGDAISRDDLLAYCNVFYFGE